MIVALALPLIAAGCGSASSNNTVANPPTTTTTAAAGAAKTGAALGASVFSQQGCGACHTLAAAGSTGKTGPNLAGVGGDPAATIKESIVKPNASVEKGYAPNVMPQNFGQSLTPAEIDGLVAYLQKVAK